MAQGTLLPNLSEVKLVCLRPKDGVIQMELLACRRFSACPACGKVSHRVHSRYSRKLGDLLWEGLPVLIVLQTRRFSCVGETCPRSHLHRTSAGHRGPLCVVFLIMWPSFGRIIWHTYVLPKSAESARV